VVHARRLQRGEDTRRVPTGTEAAEEGGEGAERLSTPNRVVLDCFQSMIIHRALPPTV
jgi:hypothetical protein